jgi:hypothetical protein
MDGKSMRYNHESYLPIGAFQPILGRMTLHGGGGGGVLDTFSDIIGTGGGDQGLLNVVDEGVQAVGSGLAEVDDFVNEEIPGGWLLPAAVAVAVATGYVDPTLFATEAGTAGLTTAESAALAKSAALADSAMIGAEGLVQGSGLGAGAFTSAIPEYPMTVTPELASKTAAETYANIPSTTESINSQIAREAASNINSQYTPKFLDNPVDYLTQKATSATDYLTNTPVSQMPGDLYGAAKDYYNTSSNLSLARDAATAYGLANIVGGSNQEKSKAQLEEEKKKLYTYGAAAPLTADYMLKNKINAGNVYSNSNSRYTPLTRYAIGGGVGIKNLIKNK